MPEATANLSYLWQVPGKRVSVRVSLDVVDRLDLAVMEGFQSLPRRGLEAGGLLLGKVRRSGDASVVDIENFEPIECEHAVGPSYLLSVYDRKMLEERIRWHKSFGRLSVVGFYRSHTRKDFAVTQEDVDLMSAYFPEPSNVFLLIHAHRDAPPTAGFAIWEGRKIISMTPYLEFPFRKAILAAGAQQNSVTSAAQPAPGPRTETRRPQLPAWLSSLFHQPRMRFGTPWLAIGLAVILLAGLLAVISNRRPVPAVASVPLGLRAAHEGSGVRLLWDRSAPVVKTATRAVLWIGDGPSQTKLDIDPQQLSGGSIVFWPRNGDITFRMEIFAPKLFGRESVTIAGMRQETPEARPSPFQVAQSPTPAPASITAASDAEIPRISPPPRTLESTSDKASEKTSDKTSEKTSGNRTSASSTTPASSVRLPEPSTVSASAKTPAFPDAPEIAAGPAGNPEAMLRETEILKARPPEISHPFVSVTLDPLPESRRGGLLGKLPLLGKRNKQRTDFVPPRPVREAPTNVPAELRQRTKHEVPVEVKLYVDRAGKVEYAELLSEGTGADRDLASWAVFSSRQWQFAPARLGDESVPAEVVLRFRFSPEVH